MTTETEGLPELAGRVARLEGAYERVDRQLESLDRRYEGIVHSLDQLRADMTGHIENLRSETNARLARPPQRAQDDNDRGYDDQHSGHLRRHRHHRSPAPLNLPTTTPTLSPP